MQHINFVNTKYIILSLVLATTLTLLILSQSDIRGDIFNSAYTHLETLEIEEPYVNTTLSSTLWYNEKCNDEDFEGLTDEEIVGGCAKTSNIPNPNFHLLIPMTNVTLTECQTLKSALLFGYRPTLINYGKKYKEMESHRKKIEGTISFLQSRSWNHSDIIAMVDGRDAWYQKNEHELLDLYHRMGGAKRAVIMGADYGCWPNGLYKNEDTCARVPVIYLPPEVSDDENNTFEPYKLPSFVNSGLLIGYAKEVSDMLFMLEEHSRNGNRSDQYYFNEILSSRTKGLDAIFDKYNDSMELREKVRAIGFNLDYWSILVQTTSSAAQKYSHMARELRCPTLAHMKVKSPLKQEPEGQDQISVIAHLNGFKGKFEPEKQNWFDTQFWFGICKSVRSAVRRIVADRIILTDNGSALTYNQLCNEYDPLM